MKIKHIRLYIQLFCFTFFTLMFFYSFHEKELANFLNSFHFLSHFSSVAWIILPTFWGISLLSLLHPLVTGRIYCSFVCPVGFLQDFLASFRKFKKKAALNYKIGIPLFFLGLSLIFYFKGTSWYGLFDHYSNFGRLINLFKLNISIASAISLIFLSLLFLSLKWPRFFCHTICPSGALYVLFNKQAYFKVGIASNCTLCGACERHCPTKAISAGKINQNTCITCFECFEACPTSAFEFRHIQKVKKIKKSSKADERKDLFVDLLLFAIGGITSLAALKKITIPLKTKTVIPPGGKSFFQFMDKCTFCGQCVSVCPTKVLVNSKGENGIFGTFRPMMDYGDKFCSYECNACMSVCPTGALTYLPLKERQQIKMGTAKIDEKECIPYAKKRACAACAEHCPTGAVDMHLDPKYPHKVPKMADDYCIGCGACEQICPTKPKKSIIVAPQEVHSLARNPRKKKRAASEVKDIEKVKNMEDFPF